MRAGPGVVGRVGAYVDHPMRQAEHMGEEQGQRSWYDDDIERVW